MRTARILPAMHGSKLGASALAGVFFLLVVGCGSDSPTATSTVSSQPPAPTPAQTARTFTTKMIANNNPVQATMTIDIRAYDYTISVTATNLLPNKKHLINTHPNTTCANQELDPSMIGPIDYLKSDANGTFTSVTTWPRSYSIPAKGRIMAIHGADGSLDDGGHIACADMPS